MVTDGWYLVSIQLFSDVVVRPAPGADLTV